VTVKALNATIKKEAKERKRFNKTHHSTSDKIENNNKIGNIELNIT